MRNNKNHHKKKKIKDKSSPNFKKEYKEKKEVKNVDFNDNKEITESKKLIHNKKKKIVNNDKKEEKELMKEKEKIIDKEKENDKERRNERNYNIENYNYLNKRKIDLDKRLQQKLNIIEKGKINNTREKHKKFETITQFKEKQENKSRQRSRARSRKKTPSKNSDKNQDYYESIFYSQKSRNKISKDKDKDDTSDYNINMSNISRSLSLRKTKKMIESNEDLNKEKKEFLSYRFQNNSNNILTISHVNDINYLGGNNNYLYLKNRILRFNNHNNTINENRDKEEDKANFENYKDNKYDEYIGYNLYLNSESDEKRKMFFSYNNENNKDLEIRQKRLERQKNKLKEELRKAGNSSYLFKINTNPINIKVKKQKNTNNELDDKKPKIKIVNKNHNNNNIKYQINEKKQIVLNKQKRYENNFNEEFLNLNSLDNENNDDYPKEFPSPMSINTKFKADPLKFITQYYIYKDELNKITNREAIENEQNAEYNKFKNINFFDIVKLINESKKNSLENKLRKFKGKSDDENNHNNTDCSLSKTYFNQNLKSINFITEYNQNNSFTMVDPNNLRQKSNNHTSTKKNKKRRIISLINKQKMKENFHELIKNDNSKPKISKIYNKSHRDNNSVENKKTSSSINWRYDSHKSNSIRKRIRKVNFI